jgi:hypothetical protein
MPIDPRKLMILDEMFKDEPSLLLVKKLIDELELEGNTGEKGDTGERGEKGEKGDTGEQGERGPKGDNGRDGRDGRDAKDGADGIDGKDAPEVTPSDIVSKLQSLEGDERLSASAIKDLPQIVKEVRAFVGGRAGMQIYGSNVKVGAKANEINFGTGLTVAEVSGRITVTAASSGGYTVETPSGSLYNQATGTGGVTFTVTATPVYIVADGGTFFDGFGYSIAGLTVTMTNPVTQYIRSFYN